MSSFIDRLRGPGDWTRLLILSFGGLGLAPIASGTFGTLGGIVLAVPAVYLPLFPYWVWLFLLSLLCLALGVALGPWAEGFFGLKDPGAIVIDEVAGYLITVMVFALGTGRYLDWQGHLAAFLLFRAADILKPPPGRTLEGLPGGWGVMLDDMAVAFYSGAALLVGGLLGWL
ncbi:MAG TPA: phosphatidylglycerophosphatase A [Planctomycetes bacterium]|nr:phosphatidylglycerophosphatase A [Planctomycetota bacterium]